MRKRLVRHHSAILQWAALQALTKIITSIIRRVIHGTTRSGSHSCAKWNNNASNNSTEAHVASSHDSNRPPIICYNCGECGRIAPNCPKPKQELQNNAKGNTTTHTKTKGSSTDSNTALVCMAQVLHIDRAFSAQRILNYDEDPNLPRPDTNQFVCLVFWIDPSVFHPDLEAATQAGFLPTCIVTTFEPLSEPIWIITHDVPFANQGTRFAAVIYPGTAAWPVFKEGIIPLLNHVFNLRPEQLPLCFRQWHLLVHAYVTHRLEECNQSINFAVMVTCRDETLAVFFYPRHASHPLLIKEGQHFRMICVSLLPIHVIHEDNILMEEAQMDDNYHFWSSHWTFRRSFQPEQLSSQLHCYTAHDPTFWRFTRCGRGSESGCGGGRWPHNQVFEDRTNKD